MQTQVQPPGWEDPLMKEMATHCSILSWKIPDRGVWWATVHEVGKSWTQLSTQHAHYSSSVSIHIYAVLIWYCQEIKPVDPKGNQSWIFIGLTDAETPTLGPPDVKNWLTGKDPDAGKDWRQEKKGMITRESSCGKSPNGCQVPDTCPHNIAWPSPQLERRQRRDPHPFGRQLLGLSEQWGLWDTPEDNPGQSSSAASTALACLQRAPMKKEKGGGSLTQILIKVLV